MLQTQACFLAVCFSTICLFPSAGFSQEFYQPDVTYSQPYVYQGYSDQYEPNQFLTSSVISTPVLDYDSLGVTTTETYGNTEGTFVQEPVVQGAIIQGSAVQGHGMPEPLISPDYGYEGPGDMRYHLWNDHGDELKSNGVSEKQLNSMSMATVQKWHNFFHGTEGRPQH